MAGRYRMKKRSSDRLFSRTADPRNSHDRNFARDSRNPLIMRGGYRV